MAKSLAHLFDHDNVVINKSETILDRLLEILEIPEDRLDEVRDRLVNIISVKMLLLVARRLTGDKQKEAKEKLKDFNVDYLRELKKEFSDEQIVYMYNEAFKDVLQEKYDLLKSNLTHEQVRGFQELLDMIGKF